MFASVANRRMYKSINLREKGRMKKMMTYTATGVGDKITGIQEISELELRVTFAESRRMTKKGSETVKSFAPFFV